MGRVRKYDPAAIEGLGNLREQLAAIPRPEAHCPVCGDRISIWLGPRCARWIGSHSRTRTLRKEDAETGAVTYEHCSLSQATWYGAEGGTEEQLMAAIAAGQAPIQSTPESRALVETWIARILLISTQRKRDR